MARSERKQARDMKRAGMVMDSRKRARDAELEDMLTDALHMYLDGKHVEFETAVRKLNKISPYHSHQLCDIVMSMTDEE